MSANSDGNRIQKDENLAQRRKKLKRKEKEKFSKGSMLRTRNNKSEYISRDRNHIELVDMALQILDVKILLLIKIIKLFKNKSKLLNNEK